MSQLGLTVLVGCLLCVYTVAGQLAITQERNANIQVDQSIHWMTTHKHSVSKAVLLPPTTLHSYLTPLRLHE